MLQRYRITRLIRLYPNNNSSNYSTRHLATLATDRLADHESHNQPPQPPPPPEGSILINHTKPTKPIQPSIRKNPFTPYLTDVKILDIPVDSKSPNPLATMTVEELLKLKPEEYLHLNKIPYGNAQEDMKQFCMNVIQIIKELILVDPKKSMQLYKGINDKDLKNIISKNLFRHFDNNNFKRTIWGLIADPRSQETRNRIFKNIQSVLESSSQDNSDITKSDILLNYFSKLIETETLNTIPIQLNGFLFEKLLNTIPADKHPLLYLYMLHLNIQSMHRFPMRDFKQRLLAGSSRNQYIVQTGTIGPVNYQDLVKFEISDLQKAKLIEFLTVSDFENFISRAVGSNQPMKAVFYLNCMLDKFEKKCIGSKKKRIRGDTNVRQDVETLLNSLINILMRFRGGYYCIDVLKYMAMEKLKPKFQLYHILLKNLREFGHTNEFIVVLNNLKLDLLSDEEKRIISNEILALMKDRFPDSPKVIIGYMGAIYGQEGLRVLNKLKILGMPYGSSSGPSEIPSLDQVQIATVDSRLQGLDLMINLRSLAHVYQVLLNSIPDISNSPKLILKLYEEYQNFINETNPKFKHDDVITVFLDHLLRTPNKALSPLALSSDSLPIIDSIENFEVSKIIANYYHTTSSRISSVNIELLIQTAVLVHSDYQFGLQILQSSRKRNRPFTFNQIFPFIKYQYDNKNYSEAKVWYDELIKLGATSTGVMMTELLRIARQLKWDNIELKYKLNLGTNQKRNKTALEKLQFNPLMFNENRYGNFKRKSVDEKVTDELIKDEDELDAEEEENDDKDNFVQNRDFATELASVLSELQRE